MSQIERLEVVDAEIIDDDDLFTANDGPQSYGVVRGRYRFPPPPGWHPTKVIRRTPANPLGLPDWYRMTNVVSAFSDQERLQLWLEWKLFMGLRVADGVLFDEWMSERIEQMEPDAQKALANSYGERARRAAHADAAARRGTARHKMMDTYLTTGEVTGTRSMRQQLASAMAALERCGFTVMDTEFKVWHPAAGGTMGTSDARVMCQRTGQVGILDWKTQARFWTWQEIGGQLYGYDSAPWNWSGPPDDRGRWEEATPSTLLGHEDGQFAGQRVALVAHMPQAPGPGQVPVEIHEVSMEYGRGVLEVAERNLELRSVGRSTAVGRRPSGIRPPRG